MYDKAFLEEHEVKVWKNTKLYRDAPDWKEDENGNGKRYECKDFSGVAVWVLGHPVEEHENWDDEENPYMEYRNCDDLYVVMVGDDTAHRVDKDDLTLIDPLAYCSSCGQIGCSHDGRDRSE